MTISANPALCRACPKCRRRESGVAAYYSARAKKRNDHGLQSVAVQVPSRHTQEKHHDCPPT